MLVSKWMSASGKSKQRSWTTVVLLYLAAQFGGIVSRDNRGGHWQGDCSFQVVIWTIRGDVFVSEHGSGV